MGRQSEVFLTCSVSETFGITVAEALACDVAPVLPYHSPVFREFYEDSIGEVDLGEGVSGPKGLMFHSEAHLKQILSSERLRPIGVRASELLTPAQKDRLYSKVFFSWKNAAAETVAQYQRVIEKVKGRRVT